MPSHGLLQDLKPFAWMAMAAFAVGFFCYIVLGDPGASRAVAREPQAYVPVASAPASNDWNLPKHI